METSRLLRVLLFLVHAVVGSLARKGGSSGGGGGGGGGSTTGIGRIPGGARGSTGANNNNNTADDGDNGIWGIIIMVVILAILGLLILAAILYYFLVYRKNQAESGEGGKKNAEYENQRSQAKMRVLNGAVADPNGGSSSLGVPKSGAYTATIKYENAARDVVDLDLSFTQGDAAEGFMSITGKGTDAKSKLVLFDIRQGQVCLSSGDAYWVQSPAQKFVGGKPVQESFAAGTFDLTSTHSFTGHWMSESLQTGPYSAVQRGGSNEFHQSSTTTGSNSSGTNNDVYVP